MAKICFECFRTIDESAVKCPYCGYQNPNTLDARALQPGTILNGKYYIGKTLGKGGFGITYLAYDQYMHTRVAIKEFFPTSIVGRNTTSFYGNTLHMLTDNEELNFQQGIERYVKEAAVLARFSELPGIVSVKNFFYENGTAYIVMEYIDGISLKSYLEQNGDRISEKEILQIMEPVISALSVIHQNRLLHRDISPDNIMIAKNGQVKLIDFGAARYFDTDQELSMTIVLRRGYAPLEQYSRKGEQGEWTDIYGVCAVMYRAITGTDPVEALDRLKEDSLIPIKKIKKKAKVHKYIAQAIEKGLSVEPKDRQESIGELYDDLYNTTGMTKFKDAFYRGALRFLIVSVIAVVLLLAGIVLLFGAKKNLGDTFLVTQNEQQKEDSTLDAAADEQAIDKEKDEISEEKQTEVEEKEEQSSKQENEEQEESKSQQESNTVPDDKERQYLENKVETNNVDVQHAIVVAKDGILNGRNDDKTVGEILDDYGDSDGIWSGYQDANGQMLVYYRGMKNGESFVIEFQVYTDDTFKMTGAAKNGEQLEEYSQYFTTILDEVG